MAADGTRLQRLHDASRDIPVGPTRYLVGRVTSVAVAPDGTRVAYVGCHEYAPDGNDAEGARDYAAGPVPLTAYSGLHEILVWDRASGATERLTAGGAPAWSPDGERLAFLSLYGHGTGALSDEIPGRRRLYIMAADGAQVREVATAVVRPPQWSPDGRRLAVVRGEGVWRSVDAPRDALYTVGVDGADQRQLATDIASDPSWSPDGARLAFAKAEGADGAEVALYTIAADGTHARRVTTIKGHQGWDSLYGEAWIETVAWSPAGGQLLYTCGPAVCVVDLDGAPVGKSPVNMRHGSLAAWSPDGARIAVGSVGRPDRSDSDIVLYSMAPDGTDLRILMRHDADAGLQALGARRPAGPVDVAGCAAGAAVPAPAANPGLVQDCETLLAIRDVLAGGAELDWSADRPITEWEGVELGGVPPRVSGLKLAGRGLSGVIPPALADLTQLRELNLRWNLLGGVIPPELGSLAELQKLYLDGNYLTGGIPLELGSLTQLSILRLDRNHLHGIIPPELGSLTQLSTLRLTQNHLHGIIPPELGRLANLQVLDLSYNQLTGSIPAELGQLASLATLDLRSNRLTGAIPAELGELRNLAWLSVGSNPLTGCIPTALKAFPDNRDQGSLGLPDCA